MRKLLWTICGLHCVTLAFAADISYSSFQRGSAYFHLIRANLNHETVSAETRYTSKLTSIGNLWADDVPVAAITGTFFAWENQKPVAEVTVDGNLMCPGRRGSLIAIDWFGKAHILHPGYRQELDWFPFRYGLRGTVRLIESGKVCPDPKSQKFRDSSIWGKASRTAIGTDHEGNLFFVATSSSITLSDLGRALLSQKITDAVSLDGGGSTALFYRGKMLIKTSRPLCNMFVLYERSPFDNAYKDHLSKVAQANSENLIKVIGRRLKKH